MTAKELPERLEQVVAEAFAELGQRKRSLLASNSASGRLRSGATVAGLVEELRAVADAAADSGFAAITVVMGNEGPRRRRAMAETLEKLIADRTELELDAIRRDVERQGVNAKLVDRFSPELRTALANKISAFADGWTAPAMKGWHERRPVRYAIVLLVVGAVVGAIATQAVEAIWALIVSGRG